MKLFVQLLTKNSSKGFQATRRKKSILPCSKIAPLIKFMDIKLTCRAPTFNNKSLMREMLKIIVKHYSYLLYCQVHLCHYHPNVLPLFWFQYQNRFPKASVVYYPQKWKVLNKCHYFFDVPYRIMEVPERMNLLIYSCFFYPQQSICIKDVEQN